MSDKLKPCPFCGGKAKLSNIGAQAGLFCVKCDDCWAKSIFVDSHKQEEAIKAWNTRHEIEERG